MYTLRCLVLVGVMVLVAACDGSKDKQPVNLDTSGGADGVSSDIVLADAAAETVSEDVSPGLGDGVDEDGDGSGSAGDVIELPAGISMDYVEEACEGWCELQELCVDGDIDPEACEEECVQAAAADLEFLATAVCASQDTEGDSDCGVLELCASTVKPPECLTFCENLSTCDLLGEQTADFFGTSELECALRCNGFATVSHGSFDEVVACILPPSEACDLLGVFECIMAGESCEGLCGSDGAGAECGLFPGTWADEEACLADCEAWGMGPSIAVQSCIEMLAGEDEGDSPFLGGDATCDGVAAERCMDPPMELPAGAVEFCGALDDLCGDESEYPKFPSDEICAWFIAGMLNAPPPGAFHDDYEAAAACLEGIEACDEGISWLACFLEVYQPAEEPCETLVSCQDEVGMPPGEGFGLEECIFYFTMVHADEPGVLDAVLACIDAAGDDCFAVFQCIDDGGDE